MQQKEQIFMIWYINGEAEGIFAHTEIFPNEGKNIRVL
jgi:hypothetical protein